MTDEEKQQALAEWARPLNRADELVDKLIGIVRSRASRPEAALNTLTLATGLMGDVGYNNPLEFPTEVEDDDLMLALIGQGNLSFIAATAIQRLALQGLELGQVTE